MQRRKIYETLPDEDAAKHGQIRVIDESGDDYLYPEECFVDAKLSKDVQAAVVEAAWQIAAPALDHCLPALPLRSAILKR